MITRDMHRLTSPEAPHAAYVGTLANCQANAAKLSISFKIEPEPHCACCGLGGLGYSLDGVVQCKDGPLRCHKHVGRHACAIEGCTRTTKAKGRPANDQWLCSEHWKLGCPPRSKMRLGYHRYFRRAKRLGWNDDSIALFNAFWRRLVARARRRCAGDIDKAEIDRMFGW